MSETNQLLSCGRSNQFKVKDLEAFKAAVQPFDVTIVEDEGDDHTVSILANARSGISFTKDQQHILELLVEHLTDDSVAILMQIGYRADSLELVGNAVAANNKGQIRQIDLNYIYRMAQDLLDDTSEVTACAD